MIAEYRPEYATKTPEEIQAIVIVQYPTCIGWSYSYRSKLITIYFAEDQNGE